MISKELLSEVLGIRSIVMNPILEPMSKIGYLVYGSQNTVQEVRRNHKQINIYELAHKCKEYALSKGYYLRAEQGVNYKDNLQWTAFLNTNMDDGADYVDYWNNTEPEAIFKATQWVLDNVKTTSIP